MHLLARGAHLRAIRQSGLTVRSPTGNLEGLRIPAGDDPHGLGPVDVVLLTVKTYDLAESLHAVQLLVDDDTAVLPLQNGITAVEEVSASVGPDRVLGGVAYIEATVEEPGVIAHKSTFARLLFGELNGPASPRVRQFEQACRDAGIEAVVPNDIRLEMWRKWMFICAFAGLTALCRRPIGAIVADPDLLAAFSSLLEEVASLARASQVPLGDGDVNERLSFARERLSPSMRSSLLNDLESGRRLELEALNGHVVRLGRRLGVPTPANAIVYAGLKPFRDGSR